MWTQILSVIVKYWVEFLLGLIVGGGAWFIKRYLILEGKERERTQLEHYEKLTANIKKDNEDLIKHFSEKYQYGMNLLDERYQKITGEVQDTITASRNESKQDIANLQSQINHNNDGFELLRSGILSIQGKMFKDSCRKLLESDHIITLEEWEELDAAHDVYNALGGNHQGDYLFNLVSQKAANIITAIHSDKE